MRRILLLAAGLLVGLCSRASADIPNVSDAARDITYNVTSFTSNFDVPFPVYGDCTDLQVRLNGVEQSSGWTCDSKSGTPLVSIPRPITDLEVVFSPAVSNSSVEITGRYHPRWSMVSGVGITRNEFNRTIGTILSASRENYDKILSTVLSVAGRKGDVVLSVGDVSGALNKAGDTMTGRLLGPSVDLQPSSFTTVLSAGAESWGSRTKNSANTGNSIYQQVYPNVSNADGFQSVLDVPPGSTAINAGAIAGYFRGRATNGTNPVALMGVGTIEAPGAGWGVNTLLQDAPTRTLGSATGREMIGYENDLNVMNPGTTVIGFSTGGNSLAQPTSAIGYNLALLNVSTGIYWPTGFGTQNGAAQNGIALGTYAGTVNGLGVVSANAPSQKFLWGWTDGSAANQSTVLQMTSGFLSIVSTGTLNGINLGAGSYYAQPGFGLLIGGNNAISADGSNNFTAGDGTHNLRLAGPLFVPSITTTGTAVGTLCVTSTYQVYLKTTTGSCI
ncbi:MAG: hypothetical protein JO051_03430 [Acidobacteriaceae bacterium]|nr:hypothetical protein [Acidobacteriaceae bacterium]